MVRKRSPRAKRWRADPAVADLRLTGPHAGAQSHALLVGTNERHQQSFIDPGLLNSDFSISETKSDDTERHSCALNKYDALLFIQNNIFKNEIYTLLYLNDFLAVSYPIIYSRQLI